MPSCATGHSLKGSETIENISCALQVQEDLTEEKKRELEHNAEEPYGENEEPVSSVQARAQGQTKPWPQPLMAQGCDIIIVLACFGP